MMSVKHGNGEAVASIPFFDSHRGMLGVGVWFGGGLTV
jgi:hypothetical protein